MGGIVAYGAIALMSMYIYYRILNLKAVKISRVWMICAIPVSVGVTLGIYFLRGTWPLFSFALAFLAILTYCGIGSKTRYELTLMATVISTAISGGLFILSALVSGVIFMVVTRMADPSEVLLMAMATIASALHVCAVYLIFRLKRLSKGMLFLQNRRGGIVGFILSGVLLTLLLLSAGGLMATAAEWLMLGTAICISGMILWWRRGLTKQYLEKLAERNIAELEMTLAEKDLQIEKLEADNDRMATMLHKDNKLLPALYGGISDILKNNANVLPNMEHLIKQIESHMSERAALIGQMTNISDIPTTKNKAIDGLLRFMQAKAANKGIELSISMAGELSGEEIETIPSMQLQTLCADLLENAIIASAKSKRKNILFELNADGEQLEVNVKDCGIPFELLTLTQLGKRKASTHLHEGGSGIGYMTIFEILNERCASLIITEYEDAKAYTKTVTVRFDEQNQYTICSPRAEDIRRAMTGNDESNSRIKVVDNNALHSTNPQSQPTVHTQARAFFG